MAGSTGAGLATDVAAAGVASPNRSAPRKSAAVVALAARTHPGARREELL
jgi:hypothetical protein